MTYQERGHGGLLEALIEQSLIEKVKVRELWEGEDGV